MKPTHSFILVLLTFLGPKLCQAQASKATSRPTNSSKNSVAKAQGLPFDIAREMTVAVLKQSQMGSPVPVGSAVWVGNNGYLATCSHVIGNWTGSLLIGMAREPFVSADEKSFTVARAMNLFEVSLIANDPSTDVAILKANVPPSQIRSEPLVVGLGVDMRSSTPQSPLLAIGAALQTGFPKPGQTMLLAGYPLAEKVLILQIGIATGLDFFDSPNNRLADQLRIMLSLVSNPGNSGGPVFDDTGKVVGLLEANLNAPIRDENGNNLFYMRPKIDESGKPAVDESGKPILERAPYQQNAGISLAVPAKFIIRLAREQKISLE